MNDREKLVQYTDLGIVKYKSAWDLQEALFSETIAQKTALRSNPIPDNYPNNHLLFCEHHRRSRKWAYRSVD